MLDVKGVKKVYEGKGRTVEAVRDLTFSLDAGEFVCIVGPSGSGKTTLLKIISGLLDPTEGEVILEGKPVSGPPPGMAVVFQEYGRSLFPWMTVRENVELPLKQKGLPKTRRDTLVSEALAAVGLADVHAAYPWQLSGGMQQRAALCRVLVHNPKVLLLDEPFGALDEFTRETMNLELLRLQSLTGKTVVLVTHNITEAVFMSDRVAVMTPRPGKLEGILDVGFERPRRPDLMRTQAFADTVFEARRMLDLS